MSYKVYGHRCELYCNKLRLRLPIYTATYILYSNVLFCCCLLVPNKPLSVMVAEAEDGLLFSTIQVYSPPVVTVRVCVYCAVSGSSNTVPVPSVTVVESLVQVTVVAGPPVEVQVRVSWSESNVMPPGIVTSIIIIIIKVILWQYHKVKKGCIIIIL